MNNNDFFSSSGSDSQLPAKIAAEYFAANELPEPEPPTPGYLREDASKWDKLSDGQRRLIAFGVFIAGILVLALLFGIGSSCKGCGLCGGDTSASDVIGSTDGETVTIEGEIVSGDRSDDADVTVSPSDNSDYTEEVPDASVPDEPAEEPPVEQPVDKPVHEQFPSDSDAETISPVTLSDIPSGEVSGERQTLESGLLSSCNHEADNEAGSGTTSTHTGFLGFLFGCTGCSDSCSVSISESLSDPSADMNDPDRDNIGLLSGSDADRDIWPQQPDDEAYMSMLGEQLAAISDSMIRLSSLDANLSQYSDPQRVSDNDRFKEISSDMLLWCRGAEEYDSSSLSGAQALECHRVSVQLAGHLRGYIEDYPRLISGNTSGTDLVSKDDQINTVMADIVELYNALNNYSPETPEE